MSPFTATAKAQVQDCIHKLGTRVVSRDKYRNEVCINLVEPVMGPGLTRFTLEGARSPVSPGFKQEKFFEALCAIRSEEDKSLGQILVDCCGCHSDRTYYVQEARITYRRKTNGRMAFSGHLVIVFDA
mmetsp:Transcript_7135/g.14323  ORF Transcript_7135/g.14323 Transcript_7135/m.14323 type:complete len:128 (-) Transcript_7135:48-431(-)|eukprot:CAMPEP_0171498016 /NCGR_PEP_ID=MMETSP0958-20121227/7607_1 /TAXON_ID=87120 /ORGANISM="Aurantiochytrium limacinum, Strain ATCCMYA-1381" /LENGTH=127 /DNA_ID=CAMNT_0012032351 /DNA_START=50 /DNA_END=433 /DNA_ORIENTATION=-